MLTNLPVTMAEHMLKENEGFKEWREVFETDHDEDDTELWHQLS